LAVVHLALADWMWKSKKFPECYSQAARSLELDASDGKQAARALVFMNNAAWQKQDYAKCASAVKRLLEPKLLAVRPTWEGHGVHVRYAECLLQLKRIDDAVAHYAGYMKRSEDPRLRQELAYRTAALYSTAGQSAKALAAFEKVFTEHPELRDYWSSAQWGIVAELTKLKRYDQALAAARVGLGAAENLNASRDAIRRIAALLTEVDGNANRAKVLPQFQRHGPTGKDGQAGTKDDLADPLSAVKRPNYANRDRAFARARKTAGDDAAASRFRALTFLYAGRPSEALKHFADAFRRCDGPGIRTHGSDLVAVGVRAVHGHGGDLGRFYGFLAHGPHGPDGQAGTSDDRKDPFAEVGLPPQRPAADGGLAGLSREEIARLIQLRILLREFATARSLDPSLQQHLVASLNRVHTALCDWGMPGQQEQYRVLLTQATSPAVAQRAVRGALAAARGRQLHLAGIHQFWRDLDGGAVRISHANALNQARRTFDATVKQFAKSSTPK